MLLALHIAMSMYLMGKSIIALVTYAMDIQIVSALSLQEGNVNTFQVKTMKNKYTYYKVIQQNYGYGWDDVSFYETDSSYYAPKSERDLLKHDLNEYSTLAPSRVIYRRELNT